jgi:hypothetical protein
MTGPALAGLGMPYTVIASPDTFICRHQWILAAMFAVLAVLTTAATAAVLAL